jgi:hypothetical protein
LSLESTRQQTLAAHAAQRAAYLAAREGEKERRRKEIERMKAELEEKKKREERERVWKVAPGYSQTGTLVPKKVGQQAETSTSSVTTAATAASASTAPRVDPMMDLVEQLAKLDAAHSHS